MKFCPQCGSSNEDASAFCAACGAPLEDSATQPQPTQQPYDQSQPAQPSYDQSQPAQQPRYTLAGPGMGWHKFLIYFSLWAGAVLNLFSGITTLTGASYGEMRGLVYATFGALRVLDMAYGLCLIALAVLCVVTRFQLAGFKALGPKLLMGVYGVNLVSAVGYVALAGAILQVGVGDLLDTTMITSLVTSAVMMVVNYTYYKKRADLFVN